MSKELIKELKYVQSQWFRANTNNTIVKKLSTPKA